MKCAVLTLGCKVNTYESEYIKEKFKEKDFEIVNLKDNPDVIVINTCTVTNQSDSKSRKMIRLAKKTNKDAIIVVCGCASEQHKENIVDTDIDILIGNYYKSKIVDFVLEYKETHKKINTFVDMDNVLFEDMKINNFLDKTRAFVKIQDGCNNFCSYCIIPYVRGSIRSKDINVAYEEIKSLVNNGYQEIVLTGIHTGSYGTNENFDLVDLIRKISSLENLKRIRISSIEITELNDKFLNELKSNLKIVNHLHIPIQSGSNKILKLMNRKYDKEYFIKKVECIRNIRPDMNFTTDLIVGFPTETDEDFNETVDTLKKVRFSKIHTFPYSIRNNTPAALMEQVNDFVKKDRVHTILELSNELEDEYYNKFINRSIDVLVEEVRDGCSYGHTDNFIKVRIDEELKQNTIYRVKIISNVNGIVKGIRES